MSSTCTSLQELLAARGPEALQSEPQALSHVESCEHCAAVLERLVEVDELLAALPPIDAPDDLVADLMSRPELLRPPAMEPTSGAGWKGAAAAGLRRVRQGWRHGHPSGPWGRPVFAVAAMLVVMAVSWRLFTGSTVSTHSQVAELPRFMAPSQAEGGEEELRFEGGLLADEAEKKAKEEGPPRRSGRPTTSATSTLGGLAPESVAPEVAEVEDAIVVIGEAIPVVSRSVVVGSSRDADFSDELDGVFGEFLPSTQGGAVGERQEVATDDGLSPDTAAAKPSSVKPSSVKPSSVKLSDADRETVPQDLAPLQVSEEAAREDVLDQRLNHEPAKDREASQGPSDPRAAQQFLEGIRRTDGVQLQEAEGYWRNTYVPGSADFRFLAAYLEGRLGETSGPTEDALGALHGLARHPKQPLDAPDNAALAVYLQADRRAVDGRQRFLVQVGLKGTERHSGRRGSMRVAVVLDLTGEVPPDGLHNMTALLTALAEARDLGDQFQLYVTGRQGGHVVAADDFRHGPLMLALRQHAQMQEDEDAVGDDDATFVTLRQAYQEALLSTLGSQDEAAPLGSGMVLLVTPNSLQEVGKLRALAERGALGGVITSVVGIGDAVDFNALDQVALGGQGNRRLMSRAAAAAGLVDGELAAVGRVVARAIRLRIRLAPGVHLVDVLGSERLDTQSAERVRAAEESIDRRLSHNLGIAADRGDDEDGLQIVIPTFYAGDAHVVLLDVVADGAGPIAEVRARYKDLVHLENGVARARLDLPRGRSDSFGPLERNVLKNRLAMEMRSTLQAAAVDLAAVDTATVALRLRRFEALLRGLDAHVSGWLTDPDIERDLRLLAEYRRVLEAPDLPYDLGDLQNSLRYAGYLKTLPRPLEDSP